MKNREELLQEPLTEKLSDLLQIEREDWVDLVMSHVEDPETIPQVRYMSEEAAAGLGLPSEEDVIAWFDAAAGEDLADGFSTDSAPEGRPNRALGVTRPPTPATAVPTLQADTRLRQQVRAQQQRSLMMKDRRRTGRH